MGGSDDDDVCDADDGDSLTNTNSNSGSAIETEQNNESLHSCIIDMVASHGSRHWQETHVHRIERGGVFVRCCFRVVVDCVLMCSVCACCGCLFRLLNRMFWMRYQRVVDVL